MDIFSSSTLQEVESMLFWSFSPEPNCLEAPTAPVPAPAPPRPEVASRSAFARYTGAQAANAATTGGGSHRNVHKRVVEILRRIPRSARGGAGPRDQGSRGFRHMMRERQRREKMSQCYADLYNILPYVQKDDKNSIVQTAAAYIQHLKERKEGLRLRNEELIRERNTVRESKMEEEATKIKIREEANPASTVDSMIRALRCLKAMDIKARTISSEFSGGELTAVVSIETGENIVGVY